MAKSKKPTNKKALIEIDSLDISEEILKRMANDPEINLDKFFSQAEKDALLNKYFKNK